MSTSSNQGPGPEAGLLTRLHERDATVAVVGLGYVGLALASAAAEAGHRVTGIDTDRDRVDAVNQGRSPIETVATETVGRLRSAGRLRASTEITDARGVDVAVISVPTPISEYRVPDLTAVQAAAKGLAPLMKRGSLLVLESTSYPGTTEEIVVPALRAAGLHPGVDVLVGYSPERIDPGNSVWTLGNTPKIVAGLTAGCLEHVIAFYGGFVPNLVPVSNLRTAEITKLYENIFRIVNIALSNEFQVVCDGFGIDVWEVIEACATKPFGFMPFYPGPGLGGHCVPVDPFYLAYKSREKNLNTEFIELAGRINAAKPRYVVDRVADLLNGRRRSLNSSRVGLLGVAYKRNVSDVRESPAVRIVELLRDEGASVSYHDPHVPRFAVGDELMESQPLTPEYLASLDCAVVVADHDAIDWTLVLQFSPTVFDSRNVLGRLRPHPTVSARQPGTPS